MPESLTYVFCLVRSPRRPSVDDVPATIPGSREVRLLNAGTGLWLIVTSVPARDYGEAALARGLQNLDWVSRRAMAHEAVVEHFLTSPAVLPMQMFTLFTTDERALEHVETNRRRIDRILKRIERQLEWGLRLTFDDKAVRAAVEKAHAPGSGRKTAPRAPGDDVPSGMSYLARKRDLRDVGRVHLAGARVQADKLYRAMAGEATSARRRTATEEATPGSRLLLDAAFLVPSRRAGGFRAALRRNAGKLDASGLAISLTGPWPAYNFIDSPEPKPRKSRAKAAR